MPSHFSVERRTKHRNDGAPVASSSTAVPPPPPTTQGLTILPLDKNAGKAITHGRKINFSFFHKEGFHLENWMQGMDWEFLCSLDEVCYPALVKEFYNTLSIENDGIYAVVRRVIIQLNEDILGRILQLPNQGVTDLTLEDEDNTIRKVLGPNVKFSNGKILANQLSTELRLLHTYVTHILFPRIGRFNLITDRDLVMMQHIMEQTSVNLPRLILNYMWDCATKKHSSLPYGMILT